MILRKRQRDSPSDMRDILEVVAATLRKSVRECEHYDPNVCSFVSDAERIWQPVAVSGYPFSRAVTFKKSGRKVQLRANPEYFCIEVKGERTGAVFSINQPNKIIFMKRVDRLGGEHTWPVYIPDDGTPVKRPDAEVRQRGLRAAGRVLLRDGSESLHFFQDAVVLYFKPNDASTVVRAIDILTPLVEPIKPRTLPAGTASLPNGLRNLGPLLKRWAESDDADRSQLLEGASRRSLEKLVEAVEPHLAGIDKYLDSFGDRPMPEAATALGTLAECALEARLLLSSKKKA